MSGGGAPVANRSGRATPHPPCSTCRTARRCSCSGSSPTGSPAPLQAAASLLCSLMLAASWLSASWAASLQRSGFSWLPPIFPNCFLLVPWRLSSTVGQWSLGGRILRAARRRSRRIWPVVNVPRGALAAVSSRAPTTEEPSDILSAASARTSTLPATRPTSAAQIQPSSTAARCARNVRGQRRATGVWSPRKAAAASTTTATSRAYPFQIGRSEFCLDACHAMLAMRCRIHQRVPACNGAR